MASRKFISSEGLSAPVGPYSHGVLDQGLLFISGEVGSDQNGKLIDGGVEAQTQKTLEKIGALLKAAGADYHDVVKSTVYLLDMGDFQAMNKVYAKFFDKGFPARSTIAVVGLPVGAKVMIDVTAIPKH